MGVKGVGCIGSIVKNNTVDKLSIRECSLKHEELESFNKECSGARVRIQCLDALMMLGNNAQRKPKTVVCRMS